MMSSPFSPGDGLRDSCRICLSPASHHKHHGAVCCYSCRIFFRRGVGRTYKCARGDGKCDILTNSRTRCKKCRFDKCLEVGMNSANVDTYVRIVPFNKPSQKQEMSPKYEVMNLQPNENVFLNIEVVNKDFINDGRMSVDVNDVVIKHLETSPNVMDQNTSKDTMDHFETSQLKKKNILEVNDKLEYVETKTLKHSTSEDIQGILLDFSNNPITINEHAKDNLVITNNPLNNDTFLPENICEETAENICDETKSSIMSPILPIKKQPRMLQMPLPVSTVIDRKIVPVLKFTIEEEFYFHEIEAKQELIMDGYLENCEQNRFIHFFYDIIHSVANNQKIYVDKAWIEEDLVILQESFLRNKNILLPQLAKLSSTFVASLIINTAPSYCVLEFIPYFSKKMTSSVDQWKLSGCWTPKTKQWTEKFVPEFLTLRSIHITEIEACISPWAVNIEDEEYFERTMKELVEIINEDAKLLTMFAFYVLISPVGSPSCEELCGLQKNLLKMVYRYLADKQGTECTSASQTVERLQGLVPSLYNAGQIFYHRRIVSCHPNDIPTYL